ncbi:MAG: hypothetical protein GM45_0805 [actinobacterium acAMD-5]|jgi:glycerol-3-phosphate dehydrogenase|nr:MAG: hypothetical protein GM45_0805 [actinobacterium acAMD-5]
MKRDSSSKILANRHVDVAIIGGGINGAVSAAALAARGLKVALLEKSDFSSFTSQESSNMVWGGIKYLQTYEIPLVWNLCGSRNTLLKEFPNRVKQTPFFASLGEHAPFGKALGLVGVSLYWVLGRFRTHAPRIYSRRKAIEHEPLISKDKLRGAVQYNDAVLLDNDARFVFEFIKTAKQFGSTCINYCEATDVKQSVDGWQISAKDQVTSESFAFTATVLINATGPFAKNLTDQMQIKTKHSLALSKGIHLVVPRIGKSNQVMAFWDTDGRLFYVIPMHDRSVIGTTDTRVSTAVTHVTDEDREFVLEQANRCLDLPQELTVKDIISERCGVRPLVISGNADVSSMEWTSLSRKHEIEADFHLKTLTIFGGKLTDCLNVGDEVAALVQKMGLKLSKSKRWFGEDLNDNKPELKSKLMKFHNEKDAEFITEGLWRRHGRSAFEIVSQFETDPELAEIMFDGTEFTLGELLYMAKEESVVKLEDLLRRRTPIALIRRNSEIDQNKYLGRLIAAFS